MRLSSLLSSSAVAVCLAAITTTACAQETRTFNIPAGSLRDGLNAFATQSDQQLFYAGDLVVGRRTPGLVGRYTPSNALDRLLVGSGIAWSETRPGVIFLRPADASVVEAEAIVDEIVVTGTLLNVSGELASAVQSLGRDDLDRRGLATVADVLTELPQNYAGSGNPAALLAGSDGAGSNGVLATGVNLRGLGPDATLVLVNGRRLAGTGFRGEFADVSALPSAAVERVDVLLDGASALYGSDAVAGVVNVIMRRSFDGQESRLRLGASRGGAESVMASHLVGRSWSSGSALLTYEYQSQNALNSTDREYTADGDLRRFGGSDWRSLFSVPGNIVEFDPATADFVSRWAIRPGSDGTVRDPSGFAVGETNLQSVTQGVDLLPDLERHSVYARARQGLGDRLELSSDVRFSRRTYGFANAAGASIFQVTSANPFFVSPSGADEHTIAYSFLGDLGTSRQSGTSRSLGVTLGADYDFGSAWSLQAYVAQAEERGQSRIDGRVNTLFLDEALGTRPDTAATAYSAARDGFFNPFGAGAANGQATLAFIGSGFSGNLDRSRSSSANLLLEGPVFTLPGGPVAVAIGAQVREETFSTRSTAFFSTLEPVTTLTPEQGRTIAAVFAEARVPIVGSGNGVPGIRSLDLSLAGRIEAYEDFGTTRDPKIGLVWSPMEALAIRASWGTSFRAPALPQLNDRSVVGATLVPRPDGSRLLAIYLTGGNPDLQPETAETFSAGFDYRPENGLRVGVNLFDTNFSDRIAQPTNENLAGVLTDPALAPFVRLLNAGSNADDLALVQGYITTPGFVFGTLFPPSTYGAVLDGRWVNTASVRVRGIDALASYPVSMSVGDLTFEASASYLLDYESQTTPTAEVRDVLDRVGFPTRLRGRLGSVWTGGDWTAGLYWNHVSDYRDVSGVSIDAWNTADLQIAWRGVVAGVDGLDLSLNIQNLFDSEPPFYDNPTGYGFDPAQASVLGRTVALQLVKRW